MLSSVTMCKLLLVLGCLAHAGHAWHGQRVAKRTIPADDSLIDARQALTMLLTSMPEAAFQPAVSPQRPLLSNRRPARSANVRMEEMRIDSDGGAYSQQAFKDFYGVHWQTKWDAAKPVAVTPTEKRIDSDGGAYTQKEFQDFYGSMWQQKWDAATPDAASAVTTTTTEPPISMIEMATPQKLPIKLSLEADFGSSLKIGDTVKCKVTAVDVTGDLAGVTCK